MTSPTLSVTATQLHRIPGYGLIANGETVDVPDSPDVQGLIEAGALVKNEPPKAAPKKTTNAGAGEAQKET